MSIKPPPEAIQPWLIDILPDKELVSPASARTHYGSVAEEVACSLLSATPIDISGAYDIVYDGYREDSDQYIEVKNVKSGSSVPIYLWRRKKDRITIKEGHNLSYVFTIHKMGSVSSIGEIWREMRDNLIEVRVVPFHIINRALQGTKVYKNSGFVEGSRNGYERKGYCDGYQLLSVKKIRRMNYRAHPQIITRELHGLKFRVPVYIHWSDDAYWV